MIRIEVILGFIGRILVILGLALLSCVAVSWYYREDVLWSLLWAALLPLGLGLFLTIFYRKVEQFSYKEGFLIVSLAWIAASAFGAVPYLFTNSVTGLANAFFETASGFSTTGASVIADVEGLPKGVQYWRCLTNWMGGMGIIALFVAVIAGTGSNANQLFRAETPGPEMDKISPRIRENAKKLWQTYVALSCLLLVLLNLLGMDFFDALCHTFSTMATGGFSTKNNSIAYYDSAGIQWVILLFMFIAGISFSDHYLFFKHRNWSVYKKNQEVRLYVFTSLCLGLIVTSQSAINGLDSLRMGLFQTISMITTTGFVVGDYARWSSLAQVIIFLCMFMGACSGSTSGNIKPGRYLIMFKRMVVELKKMVHPRAVYNTKIGGKTLDASLVSNVMVFFFIWMVLVVLGMLLLAWSGQDLLTSISASASCLGNVGPGFGQVGPATTYAALSSSSKWVLSFLMLVGRLELYPLLIIFTPSYWRE